MKTYVQYVIAFILISSSNLLCAENSQKFSDLIMNKVHKETKAERKKNSEIAMRFANLQGRRFDDVISLDIVERIDIPYNCQITSAQVAYLFQHAVFRSYEDMRFHLLPAGTFYMTLTIPGILLQFHLYVGVPVIQLQIDSSVFWLEIPNAKDFYSLGNEKKLDSFEEQKMGVK
jgi:hypothetical protein